MRVVQVQVYPFLVDLVAPRVTGERLHVACRLLEALQVLRAVVDEEVLVVDVVAWEQQPHRAGEGEAAVRPVCGEPFIAAVRTDPARQCIQFRERIDRQPFVADAHPLVAQFDVLQRAGVLQRQAEVFLQQAGLFLRAGYLVARQTAQSDQSRVVYNAGELPGGI